MKTVKHILTLVFGILGTVYTTIGFFMLSAGSADDALFIVGNVFFWLGLVFLLATALVRYFISRSERARQDLLTWGIRVTGTITNIRVNYSVKVNRRCPVVVYAECTHPVTHEQVTLRSHNLWNCTMETGQTVDIVFDQMNEKRYAFDIREEARA